MSGTSQPFEKQIENKEWFPKETAEDLDMGAAQSTDWNASYRPFKNQITPPQWTPELGLTANNTCNILSSS